MKVLKKQWLTLLMLASLIVTLTLGVVFAFPAKSASADEVYQAVTTQTEIQNAIDASSNENPAYVKLDGDVELTGPFVVSRNQNVTIDLNGHTLTGTEDSNSRTYANVVFNQWGTVSFIDTSPKRTGLITSSYYTSMVDNRGAITFDVNIDASETPYFRHTMTLSPEGEFVCTPTMTFKGGTISLPDNGPVYDSIAVRDANVKIEGGTFISNTSSVFSISTFVEAGAKINGDDEAAVQADIEKRKAHFDTVAAHRGSKIEITGGNFSTLDGYYECLMDLSYDYTVQTDIQFYDKYNGSWSDSQEEARGKADYSVEISGGTWGFDPSAYLAPGCWAKEDPDAQGMFIVEKAQEGEAVAEVNGSAFVSFEAAWAAAQGREAMGKDTEIKLKADCEATSLEFPESWEDGAITIDLNGFTLTVTQSAKDDYHIYGYNNKGGAITLVVRDGSDTQSGELNFIYLENAERGGIYLKDDAKFVLEGGTIRRTGGPLVAVKEYSSESKEYEYKAYRTMFRLSPVGDTQGSNLSSHYEDNMVVIKGGSIVSELTGEEEWNEADRKMSFVCFEYGYNGYSSYQSTQYCLKIEPDTDYGKDEDKYYSSFTSAQDDSKTLATQKRMQVVRFDLEALNTYLNGTDRGCRFSWDLSVLAPTLVWTTSNGGYIVTKQKAEDNFSVNGVGCATFAEVLGKAQKGDTILVLNPDLVVDDESVVLDGVTLNLNTYLRYAITFTHGFTLKNGATIKNGVVKGGDVIIDGATVAEGKSAQFEKAELQCNLTINTNADIVISDGKYEGTITVNEGANLLITGGSFKGSQIKMLDKYFGKYLGAFDSVSKDYDYENNSEKLYSVQFGPNLVAQEWYKKAKDNVYEIGSTVDWLYFALYVNSGVDSFVNKIVKLTGNINFDTNGASGIALADEAKTPNFMPAGNATHRFAGNFDGQNHTMSGIYAQEKNVGLFGATEYGPNVRVMNVKVENSTFLVGSGILDSYNLGSTLAGGAIVGEGHLDKGADQWSGNITLSNVTVGHTDEAGSYFLGGVVGHSWAGVYLDGLRIEKQTTIQQAWKAGGVVGYLDGEFYIKNADIEQGAKSDGSDNGLIMGGDRGIKGVLVGHAHNTMNTVENCTILEHNSSLFGTLYVTTEPKPDTRDEGDILIKGATTDLDIFKVVGGTRESGSTEIELSGDVTEDGGVQKGSFSTQVKEDHLTFYEVSESGEKKNITDDIKESSGEGGYSAKAALVVDVTIGDLVGKVSYSADNTPTLEVSSFKLFDKFGNPIDESLYSGVTVTVTLKNSTYNVGKQVALITSYTVTGAEEADLNVLTIGNQAFIELEVQASNLTVRVNSDGTVSYEGFVGGEDESVLGGTLTLEKVDNGDGTYTVTPGGLTSENYNITYVSGIVAGSVAAPENNSNALWIALAVVGSVVLVLGAVTIIVVARKKRSF